MDTLALQKQIFSQIKNRIAEHVSAVDEIAGLLNISSDSAYRRMRGEKTISLQELCILCAHYHISLDQMMDIQTDAFQFQGKLINSDNFRFDEYLTNTLNTMAFVSSFKQKEFYTLCKDIHLFRHFQNRDLAAFKYYFWIKTIYRFKDIKSKKFSFDEYDDNLYNLGRKILSYYTQIDAVEIWNLEAINASIRQIEYYREGRMFESDEDVLRIYESLEKLLNHMEKQAILGYQFDDEDPEQKPRGSFQMYFNEVLILDNSTLAILDGQRISYMIHSVVNYMTTRDTRFSENHFNHVQNLLQKSTMISTQSEKERARFFKILHDRINKRKEALSV
jgi:hypothetical protein